MSIKNAAEMIRQQGRGNDSMLMHVTPGEVQALQGIAQVHGGSLTINPETGLPEASFLQSILPTIAGIGIGFATGNPFLGAAAAGGLGYASSGSLEKGLMSGLGAFGGASALGSLATVGGATAAGAGIGPSLPGAAAATSITPASTAAFQALPVGGKFSALGSGFSNLVANPSATFSAMGGLAGQGANLAMAGAPLLAGGLGGSSQQTDMPEQEGYVRPAVYDPATQTYTRLDPVKNKDWGTRSFAQYAQDQGYQEGGVVEQRYQQPTRTVDPAVTEYNQMLMNQAQQEYVQGISTPTPLAPQVAQKLEAAQAARAAAAAEPVVNTAHKRIYDPVTQSFSANPDYVDPKPPRPDFSDRFYDRYGMYDSGGDGGFDGFGSDDGSGSVGDGTGATGDDGSVGGGASGDGTSGEAGWSRGGALRYAGGGITNIPKFQAGGDMQSDAFVVPADVVSALGNGSTKAGLERLNQFLGIALPIEGEGDGLSDDIPATIEGEQPARVADGEAYIPPEVVAQLGGGDPERGAAMLYTMMDKIRESAHGKSTQQREVTPETVMPA